ncbi:MAG: lysylphosphatidylglycerol synthase domain-containing protein [Planctomycetes bacterium]|nr:lysylphosphatidylglycerol synthase domain-containing protein [Planctomycetota bacterium]
MELTRVSDKLRKLAPLLAIPILGVALWLLYKELKHYNIHDILSALRQITPGRLAVTLALVAVNYTVLIAYDWLAVWYLKLQVPLRRVALAALIAYVTSYNFGVLLGGTSVRYRFYSRWGLSLPEIARLVAVITLTCWLGLFALAGVVFLIEPLSISEKFRFFVSNIHVLGVILLAAVAAYFGFGAINWLPPILRKHKFEIPPAWVTAWQIIIAASDFALAAAVLYVLLDPWTTASYPLILGVYLLAMVTSYLSHVPGGLGVFELVVLTLLPDANASHVLSSLLAFRVIYFLLPLAVGLALWGGYELATRREMK